MGVGLWANGLWGPFTQIPTATPFNPKPYPCATCCDDVRYASREAKGQYLSCKGLWGPLQDKILPGGDGKDMCVAIKASETV